MSFSSSFAPVNFRKPSFRLAKFSLCTVAVAGLAAGALAANKTWDGGGADTNWMTGVNWDNDVAPAINDALFFDGSVGLTNNNDFAANTLFNGITFNATAGAFVLGGNAINLGGDLTDNNTSLTETINLTGLALTRSNTNATVVAGGTLSIGSVISGAGGLTKLGAGTLVVTGAGGANTYFGTTTISAGTLQIGNPTAGVAYLGTGLVSLNGGTLLMSGFGGPYSLANTVDVATASTVAVNNITGQANNQLGGRITGSATLNLALQTGTTFGFSGNMTAYSGTVSLGTSAGTVRFNGSAGSNLATFDIGSGTTTFNIRSSPTVPVSLGALTGGPNTNLANAAGAAVNWVVGGKNINTTYSGDITGTSSATVATQVTFNKAGFGTLTFDHPTTMSLTGTTNVNRGTLLLDFVNMATPTNLLNGASTLGLGGGTFSVKGQATGTTEQDFVGTNVNAGSSTIVLNPNGGTATNLLLGNITRVQGGTVNYTPVAGGTVSTTTANALFTGGQQTILGGYATVNGNTWAVSGTGATAGTITGLPTSGYTNTATTALASAAALDIDVAAAGNNATTAALTVNSLRFNDATGAATVDATGGLTVATGGILVNASVGANASTISGGTLTSGSTVGNDLVVIQNNAGAPLTISSQITGARGFVKSGPGTVILTATNNNNAAGTFINEGTLILQSNGTTAVTIGGTTNSMNLNGGTLALNEPSIYSLVTGAVNISATSGISNLAATDVRVNGAFVSIATAGATTLNLSSPGGGQITHAGIETGFTGNIVMTGSQAFTYRFNSGGNTDLGTATALYDLGSTSGNTLLNRNGAGLTYNLGALQGQSGTILRGASDVTAGTASTYSIGALNLNTTFAGSIQNGTGNANTTTGITKVGAATLTLTGANTYTGATIVSAGTLAAQGDGTLGGTSAVTINSGGVLTLSGGTTNNYISDFANVTLTAATATSGNGIINLNFTGAADSVSSLTVNGVSLIPGIYTASSTQTVGYLFGTGSLLVAPMSVPEPSTWAMVLLGGTGLGWVARRARRTA